MSVVQTVGFVFVATGVALGVDFQQQSKQYGGSLAFSDYVEPYTQRYLPAPMADQLRRRLKKVDAAIFRLAGRSDLALAQTQPRTDARPESQSPEIAVRKGIAEDAGNCVTNGGIKRCNRSGG